MRFYDALRAEMERVDQSNWAEKLVALKEQNGTWTATARALGVHKRTLERARLGYRPRGGGPRRFADPRSLIDKVRKALAKDRRAQVAAVDWKRLKVNGTITLGGGEYEREENMHIGRYFTDGQIEGIADAYIAGDADRVQRAVDHAMSEDYIGDGATTLDDVTELNF